LQLFVRLKGIMYVNGNIYMNKFEFNESFYGLEVWI